jgi:hypothetical protein
MLQVGFEPTIPVFQLSKTVHVLDRAATVIGYRFSSTLTYSTIPRFEFLEQVDRKPPLHAGYVKNSQEWLREYSNFETASLVPLVNPFPTLEDLERSKIF